MMKRLSFALILTLALSIGAAAHAQISDQSDRGSGSIRPLPLRPLPIGDLREKKDEIKAEIRDRLVATGSPRMASDTPLRINMMNPRERASSTNMSERRIAFQQDIAKRRVENTMRILTATVDRLENILGRINSRIDKVNASGDDTTASEASAAEASQDLTDARTAITSLKSIDLTSDNAKENFEAIRTGAQTVQEEIKSAHKALEEAVSSLKQGNNEATTTPDQQ
jgi:hypothetical protein